MNTQMTARSIRFIASMAGWLLLGSLQAVCGAPPEMRTWTSPGDQKTMEAEYAGLANGKVSLRLANKRLTQVPLEKISDADKEYVKSQLGKLRDWTAAKSGKKATAQFVQLTENGMVELLMEDYKAVMLPRASLVAADQKYLDTEAPIPLIRRLPGSWTGHSIGSMHKLVHRMEIRSSGGKLRAEHIIYLGLTDEELDAALKGKLKPSDPLYVQAFVVKCESTITLDGDQMTFEFGELNPIFLASKVTISESFPKNKLLATCPKAGLIMGKADPVESDDPVNYFFTKVGSYDHSEPTDLERGKTHLLTSPFGNDFHYFIYIPKSYRPDKPAPLLVSDSSGGSAQPLSIQAAEKFGWICMGLKESRNGASYVITEGNCLSAVLDARRMLNIHPQRYYFCGLSGGARRSSSRALFFPSNTAGLICMAAGFSAWSNGELKGHYCMPPLKVAAFLIVGGPADMNNSEVKDRLFPALQKQKRACELIVHPGGHDWGRPEDHMAAITWLEKQWENVK